MPEKRLKMPKAQGKQAGSNKKYKAAFDGL